MLAGTKQGKERSGKRMKTRRRFNVLAIVIIACGSEITTNVRTMIFAAT